MKLLQICAVMLLYVAADLHQKRPPTPSNGNKRLNPSSMRYILLFLFFFNGKRYNSRRTTGHFVPIMRVYSE